MDPRNPDSDLESRDPGPRENGAETGGARNLPPLLAEPLPDDDQPGRTAAYGIVGCILISLFFAYHATLMVAYNLPTRSMNLAFQRTFNSTLQGTQYIRATGFRQNWGMFAPNPPQHNEYIQIEVADSRGQRHSFGRDLYNERKYPYLFYQRQRKINLSLIESAPLRKSYAAYVCRAWEREHPDVPPTTISFFNKRNKIPTPEQVYSTMTYDSRGLPVARIPLESHTCADLPHGRIPDRLRERYGMGTAPEGWVTEVEYINWTNEPELAPRRERPDRSREDRSRPTREPRERRSRTREGGGR
jgi:hypothetical protein